MQQGEVIMLIATFVPVMPEAVSIKLYISFFFFNSKKIKNIEIKKKKLIITSSSCILIIF